MCGIFGIVLPSGEKPDHSLVQKATDTLRHRGPDSGGYFFSDNLALGNRRLSILDLSAQGKQPMSYQNLTITYNGELYNYLELKAELQQKGHRFQTKTDTEVVLAAYQEWGSDALQRFNGMWAFAIYDQTTQQIFCARDRFGIKPFYYYWQNQTFAFASEVKAFRPLPFWQAELNQEMAGDYLLKGLQNHTSQTLYKSIFQLPPGHHLTFDLKRHHFKIQAYYNLRNVQQRAHTSYEQSASQFKQYLNTAIQLHTRSDVKVGTALSGGLDSSSILALQYEQLDKSRGQLEVVSYVSDLPAFDESPYIKALLQQYSVELHQVSANFEKTFSTIDSVILAQDEPLLSASLVAQYLVFQKAKENGLKVMLDGQGADEILAGYGTYYVPFLKEVGWRRPFLLGQEIWGLLNKHQIKASKKLSFFKKGIDLSQYLNLSVSKPPMIGKGFQNYSRYMIEQGILPSLLQFEDRNSMAHSVESRVPFLDYRLVEFCMSLPPHFKIKKGVRKAILREAMQDHLPQKILQRYDKMGFSTPQEHWMFQHRLIILTSIQKSVEQHPAIFKPNFIQFAENALAKNQNVHFRFLWRVMTFGRWLDLYDIQK